MTLVVIVVTGKFLTGLAGDQATFLSEERERTQQKRREIIQTETFALEESNSSGGPQRTGNIGECGSEQRKQSTGVHTKCVNEWMGHPDGRILDLTS